jgi:hypothetical protein
MNTSGFERFEAMPSLATAGAALIQFDIPNEEVVEENIAPFLEFWNVDRIASAGRLHEFYGKVLFTVGGYDTDSRHLCEIPEVRKFLKALVGEWPYFFYAQSLADGFLVVLMQCLVPKLTTISIDSNPAGGKMIINPSEFNAAYRELYAGLIKVCSMCNMSQEQFDKRDHAIRLHLKTILGAKSVRL